MFFNKDEHNKNTILPDTNSDIDDEIIKTEDSQVAQSEPVATNTIIFHSDSDDNATKTQVKEEPENSDENNNESKSVQSDPFTAEPEVEFDGEINTRVLNDLAPAAVKEKEVSDRFTKVEFKDSDKVKKNKKGKNKKPTNPKKKYIILGSIAAVLVTLTLLIVFNFQSIVGFFIKNFCSDATYFKYVEALSFEEYSEDAVQIYNQYKELFSDKQCKDFTISLNAKDKAIELAELYTVPQYGIGLDFLNNTTIDGTINISQKNIHAQATAKIDDEELISGKYIRFGKDGEEYYAIPTFTDKYLKQNVTPSTSLDLFDLLDDPDVKKVIPFDGDMKDFVLKYIKIAIEEISDVTSTDKEVFIGNTSQKVRALQFTLDTNTFNAIKKNIYTEFKQDDQAKQYIDKVADVLVKKGKIKAKNELYDMIIESVNKDLKQIEKYQKNPVNKQLFTLIDYVDSNHKIIGRDLIIDGKTVMSTLRIDETFNLNIKPTVNGYDYEFYGTGSIVNDVFTGEFSLDAEGSSMCKLNISEVNIVNAKNGNLSGKLTINPGSDLWSFIPDMDTTALKLANLKFKCDFAVTKSTVSLNANLFALNQQAANIKIDAKEAKRFLITKPDQKDVVETTSDFVGSFEFFKKVVPTIYKSGLIDNIEDSGVFWSNLAELGLPNYLTSGIDTITSLVDRFL